MPAARPLDPREPLARPRPRGYPAGVNGDGNGDGLGLGYPLEYTFKIIGRGEGDFAEHVRLLVERIAGNAPAGQVAVRPSARGNYHSVAVVARLESEEQRRAVYLALHQDERVLYCL